ncbi:MAG: OadG family protein [Tidjanibacter sp.]|nr:OadG family protein [Tidjanibacter sp.]MBR6813446.1 OadG family protein [Tidjanibacter sp.]
MKKFLNIIALGIAMLVGANTLSAQGINNVKINEILVVNQNNYVDDYGNHESWIELMNTGYENVNIGGCYLGVVLKDGSEVKYYIPSRDNRMKLSPLSYVVFFCEGTDTKGAFHTSFTLDNAEKIIFYNANGRDVIDEMVITAEARTPDVSYGRSTNAEGETVIGVLSSTTPNASNENSITTPRHEVFRQRDKSGIVMTLTAMSVVFSALVLIFLVLKAFTFLMNNEGGKKKKAAATAAAPAAKKASMENEEVVAAIATALDLYRQDLHDREDMVITIQNVGRRYSPWSSKIHGLTALPNKK